MTAENIIPFRPQAAYWRRAIRNTENPAALRGYAESLIEEVEAYKAAFREAGQIPPKFSWAPGEQADKERAN